MKISNKLLVSAVMIASIQSASPVFAAPGDVSRFVGNSAVAGVLDSGESVFSPRFNGDGIFASFGVGDSLKEKFFFADYDKKRILVFDGGRFEVFADERVMGSDFRPFAVAKTSSENSIVVLDSAKTDTTIRPRLLKLTRNTG